MEPETVDIDEMRQKRIELFENNRINITIFLFSLSFLFKSKKIWFKFPKIVKHNNNLLNSKLFPYLYIFHREPEIGDYEKKSSRERHQEGRQAGSQHPSRVARRRGVAHHLKAAHAQLPVCLSLSFALSISFSFSLFCSSSLSHYLTLSLSPSSFQPLSLPFPLSPGCPGFPPW